MKSLILAVIVTVMSFSQISKAQNDDKDLWKSTNLSWDDLKSFLTPERCYQNENSFLGCIMAVDAILLQSKPAVLLANAKTSAQTGVGALVTTQEGLEVHSVQRVDDSAADPLDLQAKYTKERLAANQSWKDIYKSIAAKKSVNFANLVTYASSKLAPDIDRVETRVAEVVNQFYGVAYDPHTHLMSEDELKEMSEGASESFSGIGAQLQLLSKKIFLSPMEDSPAVKAGIRKNDQLAAVDGVALPAGDDLKLIEVVKKIKGPAGTNVTISVIRGDKKLDIVVTRGPVTSPFLKTKILTDSSGQKTGYIRLRDFMAANPCEGRQPPFQCAISTYVPPQGTCDQFAKAAQDLHNEGATKLVLDLRDNGGGSVPEALCMVSLYAPAGKSLLTIQDPQTNQVKQTYNGSGIPLGDNNRNSLYELYQSPLIILINGSSASASELFSGSLQDFREGVIVGEQSFGKGTMQGGNTWQEGPADKRDKIALFKTIARFHLPSGRSNQLVGLTPDFEVYGNPHPTAKDKLFLGREKDLYVNPIMPASKPYQPDVQTVSKVKNCIDGKKDLDSKYQEANESALGADFQLIYAQEVAACL